MKRLKYYILSMKANNSNYNEIYEGQMVIPGKPPELYFEPTYWKEDIAYTYSRTNKLELDKPTVFIKIPIEKLFDMDNTSPLLKQLTQYLLNNQALQDDEYLRLLKSTAEDHILRVFIKYIDILNEKNVSNAHIHKKNGYYYIYSPNGKVLTRNSATFGFVTQKYYKLLNGNVITIPNGQAYEKSQKMCISIMIQIQLPEKNHKKAIQMLTDDLPAIVEDFIEKFSTLGLARTLALADQQAKLRAWLKNSNYCAFIANGSILPRLKETDLPLMTSIPFQSPAEDEIEACGIKGMGIKKGITVITGGGYSGKSTILDAISDGIYNHIAGDGRELVITDDTAFKISAEDGRSIKNVNISPFIKWLPNGDTLDFSTEHASGSTSQAANIMESINIGAKLLLIDEDKSATNFMIRDNMMKKLIEREPITPFTERVNELYNANGISTILVIGGSGEYLSVADKIYIMQDYCMYNVTNEAKSICEYKTINYKHNNAAWKNTRVLLNEGFTSYPNESGTEKLEISNMGFFLIGDEVIDIRMLHNIASTAQLNSIGFIIRRLENKAIGTEISIDKQLYELYNEIDKKGLDIVFDNSFSTCTRFLDLPRKCEVLSVINRMRKIKFMIKK